jgi:hypothetical protein
MKSIIFSDLHLHDWQEFSSIDPETGLNTRFMDGLKVLKEILGAYEEGDTVIFCGDFFHDGSRLKPEHVYYVMDVFRAAAIPVNSFLAIPGQHDYSVGSRKYSALDVFVDYMSEIMTPGPCTFNGEKYFLIPHMEKEKVAGLLSEYREGDGIIIGHFLADELLAKAGFVPLPNSVSLQDGVQPPMAFLGDFHIRAVWNNWVSLGSPHQHSFSDAGKSSKGYWIYDKKEEYNFLHHQIDAPCFVVIEDAKRFFDSDLSNKNFYRVHVKNEGEMKAIKKKLDSSWKIRFVVEDEESATQQPRMEVNVAMKPADIISSYCDYRERQEMKADGIRYYEERE